MAFAPLHVHSTHSLLRGIPSIPELVACAKERGYQALALTDVNTMAGSILFLQECRQQGIKPILGLELQDERDPELRLVLLARNAQGYGDLCELASFHNLKRRGPDLDHVMTVGVAVRNRPDRIFRVQGLLVAFERAVPDGRVHLPAVVLRDGGHAGVSQEARGGIHPLRAEKIAESIRAGRREEMRPGHAPLVQVRH